jgi:hypothetical protein
MGGENRPIRSLTDRNARTGGLWQLGVAVPGLMVVVVVLKQPKVAERRFACMSGRVVGGDTSIAVEGTRAGDRLRTIDTRSGAPQRNHTAITASKMMQPNDDVGTNGQIGLP